jgi:CRISPR-associated endonuclease Csn1
MFKEPIGTVWIKKIKEVSLREAIRIQTIWEEVKNDSFRKKREKYIYDDYAQKVIARVVHELGLNSTISKQDDEKINKFINEAKASAGDNNNLNATNKTIYNLEGRLYEKIKVAEYVLYKAKRMSVNKKEYMEKLSLQKMYNDLPNFILEKSILDNYPEILKELKSDKKYIIEPHKKNNPVNRLLLEHILEYNNNPKEAFSAEGIEKLNKKAIDKIGKPIKTITRLDGTINEEEIFRGAVFETDKGSNVYFVMYENNQTKEREFLKPNPSISVLKAIENKNKIDSFAPNRQGFTRIILSPGDLVYVPTNDQYALIKENSSNEKIINWNDNEFISHRIYQVKKFTGNFCYFLKNDVANLILPYSSGNGVGEFESQNISEYSVDDPPIRIKDVCIKIRVDRLGNVRPL